MIFVDTFYYSDYSCEREGSQADNKEKRKQANKQTKKKTHTQTKHRTKHRMRKREREEKEKERDGVFKGELNRRDCRSGKAFESP